MSNAILQEPVTLNNNKRNETNIDVIHECNNKNWQDRKLHNKIPMAVCETKTGKIGQYIYVP
jgi:hypothetical protein